MNADDLYEVIKKLIDEKATHPKLLTYYELRKNVTGGKRELNKSFRELRESGRIVIRDGINQNLIEIV